jgi:Sigma-70, region 4
LRRADSLDPEGAPAWLRTVVKHEALAIRAARRRIVGPAEVDLDRTEARELEPADERAADGERMGRSAEALARLKPAEVRALVLKAHGYSYKEICEITGWTYTNVKRRIGPSRPFLMSTTLLRPEYPAGGYVGIARRCGLLALVAHLPKQMACREPCPALSLSPRMRERAVGRRRLLLLVLSGRVRLARIRSYPPGEREPTNWTPPTATVAN